MDLEDGVVTRVVRAKDDEGDEGDDNDNVASRLVLPPLCHPHLHLDMAYLLTGGGDEEEVDYSDLLPQTGSFGEALQTTAAAKARFTAADLQRRGMQLLATSYRQGVTAMRVFVEVDAGAAGGGRTAVEVAGELRAAWEGRMDVQVCVFAQEALFESKSEASGGVTETSEASEGRRGRDGTSGGRASGGEDETNEVSGEERRRGRDGASGGIRTNNETGNETTEIQTTPTSETQTPNQRAIEAVLVDPVLSPFIHVLGSAPYVEQTPALARRNLDWAVTTALRHGLHLDLHLDYTLDDGRPLVWDLLDALERHCWTTRARDSTGRLRTVAVGHATQLTRLSVKGVQALAAAVKARGLPVHLVGLPMSDVYMMGRPKVLSPEGEGQIQGTDGDSTLDFELLLSPGPPGPPRGTLNIPLLLRAGLPACLGVNNVGNAFTPHGTGDPLQMACFGVGLYHAGTGEDARELYGAVSWGARVAIGCDAQDGRSNERSNERSEKNEQSEDQNERSEEKSEDSKWWEVDPPELVGRSIGPVLVFTNEKYIQLPSDDQPIFTIPARHRTGFRDVVWDPPDTCLRKIIH